MLDQTDSIQNNEKIALVTLIYWVYELYNLRISWWFVVFLTFWTSFYLIIWQKLFNLSKQKPNAVDFGNLLRKNILFSIVIFGQAAINFITLIVLFQSRTIDIETHFFFWISLTAWIYLIISLLLAGLLEKWLLITKGIMFK